MIRLSFPAHIGGSRTNESPALTLFRCVGNPANGAAQREQAEGASLRQLQKSPECDEREVDVRPQARRMLDRIHVGLPARTLAGQGAEERRGSHVAFGIQRMAEARYFFAALHASPHDLLWMFRQHQLIPQSFDAMCGAAVSCARERGKAAEETRIQACVG